MRVEDVVDRESLEAFLAGLPDDVRKALSIHIAFRSAARVAPLALRFFAENRPVGRRALTALPCFAGIILARVAGDLLPTSIDALAAKSAANVAAYAATNSANSSIAASNAGRAAARAAARNADRSAARAADSAANAAAKSGDQDWYWSIVRDDLSSSATEVKPLWPNGIIPNAFVSNWQSGKAALLSDKFGTDWNFWIVWYERVLSGRDVYSSLLAPILNELREKDWLGDPDTVNARFAEVLQAYQADGGEPADSISDVTNAAYFDFIEVNREMRAVGFPSDYAAFPDNATRDAFLEAANDTQLSFENWCELAKAQMAGRNRPVAAVVAVEQILDQLTALGRGERISLRNLVRLGSNAKRLARSDDLAEDLGDEIFEMLGESLDDYSQLVRAHLGGALAALLALRSLELGELDSAECMRSLKEGVAYLATLSDDVLLPFDARTRAVIADLIADLEDEQSEIGEATTEVARQNRGKRFAEKFGGVSATIREYILKASQGANKGGDQIDKAGKWHKRWETLEKIKDFWDKLPKDGWF